MHRLINKHNRDYLAGALMIVLGLGAALQGRTYEMGTLSRMGPGYYPFWLGVILAGLGVLIMLNARGSIPEGEEEHLPPEWRGWICILLSIVAFIVLGTYGGLLPASFAITFISALGDRNNTVKDAFFLAVAVAAVAAVIFWWALQVQFPLFQWG